MISLSFAAPAAKLCEALYKLTLPPYGGRRTYNKEEYTMATRKMTDRAAFCVRVPVSYIMSIQPETSLFHIGLATPMSSALQLILCVGFMLFLRKKGMLDDKKI